MERCQFSHIGRLLQLGRLRIGQQRQKRRILEFLHCFRRAVGDEYRSAAPANHHLLARRDLPEIELDRAPCSQRRGIRISSD